ncbi:MAG: hypothetical protein WA786_04940 [Acidimicrobiales bacterium]
MKWVSVRISITCAPVFLIAICTMLQVASSASIRFAQRPMHPSRSNATSTASTFVAAYDTLVAAAFTASNMENSPNVLTRMKGLGAELAARKRFDEVLRSLPIPTSAGHDILRVETTDHLIEVDLRHLEVEGKGIVNSDPLHFYLAVASLAKYLGVESTTWPPASPAGPTAGD